MKVTKDQLYDLGLPLGRQLLIEEKLLDDHVVVPSEGLLHGVVDAYVEVGGDVVGAVLERSSLLELLDPTV